jgi:hypothetical protein
MKTWDGLNAEEIASIPRDEYCFQKIERILRERNELKELSDDEIRKVIDGTWWVGTEEEIRFKIAKAVLEKASEI